LKKRKPEGGREGGRVLDFAFWSRCKVPSLNVQNDFLIDQFIDTTSLGVDPLSFLPLYMHLQRHPNLQFFFKKLEKYAVIYQTSCYNAKGAREYGWTPKRREDDNFLFLFNEFRI
jgi:hypothetical protein